MAITKGPAILGLADVTVGVPGADPKRYAGVRVTINAAGIVGIRDAEDGAAMATAALTACLVEWREEDGPARARKQI
jgi:hypothetical protein